MDGTPPRVLFVCVRNAGKSQLASGLMQRTAGGSVAVASAGTSPGSAVNALSAQALAEVGVDITAARPRAVTAGLVADADVVVTLGAEAQLDPAVVAAAAPGTRFETWVTDEPSARGIDGLERMRLVRDDIDARVTDLYRRLTGRLPGAGGAGR
ncbi:low molecular weight phosphatase family protein [Modestobacter sp. I12A-02628]|uniref:Low molecular weight phosphatase family protein n=1 Tax=Goekera deserti TaxID=2497753 RepID=A0A7K3WCU8_9ACTN|nr:low molecular weight phosphatase family protein [Goekera deserti]MPQ96959.1 low molecular weight phosphatase family protein [Goekera deserti]NDI46726.1 low molecular weight phosphatase family protein [Goekera deserti]NEL54295.1 low molecular weight phosphatase family protein [Goekera deserti]